MLGIGHRLQSPPIEHGAVRPGRWRVGVFLGVFLLVAAAGLIHVYSRPAIHLATARISVEPPGPQEDPLASAQFAVVEAQALRRSELMQAVASRLGQGGNQDGIDAAALERQLSAEPVPQTGIIELRAQGQDQALLVAALGAWIEAYMASRKEVDRQGVTESAEEARHALKVANDAVEEKRREMETFRRRHGIASIEREENASAARLKGLLTALNDAEAREVNAEAKLKAVSDSIARGVAVVRSADKNALAALEMRAVDLREKVKDLESDYTPQYLAMDPKFKALKANLARVEQQLAKEKERSQQAALIEAQEELAGAKRAAQRLREQIEALKQESQTFSTRFVELKRMAVELEQLQEARAAAVERLRNLESARKPATAKVRVLSAPSAAESPSSPDYGRDAAVVLAAALGLGIVGVWLTDFLRGDTSGAQAASPQPIIQIAYPVLPPQAGGTGMVPLAANAPAALPAASPAGVSELTPADVSALWGSAPSDGRLIIAALLSGIAPDELLHMRLGDVDLDAGTIAVPGASARRLRLTEPLREAVAERLRQENAGTEALLVADGLGNALDEPALDAQLARIAHDAGIRHPEEVTARAVHFTYAAYLARQGMRMTDLAAHVGRLDRALNGELMRLAPAGRTRPVAEVDLVYPSFRAV